MFFKNLKPHIFPAYLIVLNLLLMLYVLPVSAQFYNGSMMRFGKNRVQYKKLSWNFYKFKTFDVYFSKNGEELARFVVRYANSEIALLEKKTGARFTKKINFIVFETPSDLKQTNISLDETGNSAKHGGFQPILNDKALLYFDGNMVDFKTQIRKAIVGMLFDQLTYDGSIIEWTVLAYTTNFPGWFKKGYVSYMAEEWNTKTDNFVRDGFLSGRFNRLKGLSASDEVYAGHSFWKFVAVRYGGATINRLVQMCGITRNINLSFKNVLGIGFKQLEKNWRDYYLGEYRDFVRGENITAHLLPLKYKNGRVYTQPSLNPGGHLLAYTTNEWGKIKIFLYDLVSKKRREIFSQGHPDGTLLDYSYPVIGWYPDGKLLTFVTENKGRLWLYLYNLHDKKLSRQSLPGVDKVIDFSWSNDGRIMVMSAVWHGQTDLFLYHMATRSFEKITDDKASELSPRFIFNSKQIVFSSNSLDTCPVGENGFGQHFDLFLLNLQRRSKHLQRLTHTPEIDEIKPDVTGKNIITYLSDNQGTFNVRMAKLDTVRILSDDGTPEHRILDSKNLTNCSRSVWDQQICMPAGKQVLLIFDHGQWKIYLRNLSKPTDSSNVRLTTAPFWIDKQKATEKQTKFGEQYYSDKHHAQETILFPKPEKYKVKMGFPVTADHYEYHYVTSYYQVYTKNSGTAFYIPSFNLRFKQDLTDLMEDYRLRGAVDLAWQFVDNSYLASYTNDKNRLDQLLLFHRTTIESGDYENPLRIHTDELFYKLKWPFNEVFSINGVAHYQNNMFVHRGSKQAKQDNPADVNNWLGFTSSLVYDGTRSLGLNLYSGVRWEFFSTYSRLLQKGNQSLFVVGFDYRYYLPIFRSFILASRVAGSSSLGNDRLIYYLGGVDNWIFSRFNPVMAVNPLQHYAYRALASNLRGFSQNIRNGNSFFVLNTELRLPVFRLFADNPLSSDFVRNFQVVAFGDMGTAWSSSGFFFGDKFSNRFLPNNDAGRTESVVGGVGAGLRFDILGFFMRADLAWGIEHHHINRKPVFYLSLNLDF